MSFKSIKGKIRGLRRKAKRIEQWKQQNIDLDIDILLKYGKEYVKVMIPPFYNLYKINEFESGHKNPLNWFKRLIFQAMIEIYESWNLKLKELNRPYYLKIWLYDPDFIKSQVVTAIGDNIEYYETLFTPDDVIRVFPKDKYKVKNADITKLSWELMKDEYVVYMSEHIDDTRYLNYIMKKSYKIQTEKVLGKDETCFYVKEGDLWVGSLEQGQIS